MEEFNSPTDSGTLFDLVKSGWRLSANEYSPDFSQYDSITMNRPENAHINLAKIQQSSLLNCASNNNFLYPSDETEHYMSESSTCESRVFDLNKMDDEDAHATLDECVTSNLNSKAQLLSYSHKINSQKETINNTNNVQKTTENLEFGYCSHDLSSYSTNPSCQLDQFSEVDSCEGEGERDLSISFDLAELDNLCRMNMETKDSSMDGYDPCLVNPWIKDDRDIFNTVSLKEEGERHGKNFWTLGNEWEGGEYVQKNKTCFNPFEYLGGCPTLSVDNFIEDENARGCLSKFAFFEKNAQFDCSASVFESEIDIYSKEKDLGSDESLWSVVQLASGK